MRKDFIPKNVDLWISNWKRPEALNRTIRSWLTSFNFEVVNVVANHSSITMSSIDKDLKSKVKIWPNMLRHDKAIGPQAVLYNQMYLHTFLAGKNYCIHAHDNMEINPDWVQKVVDTDYDLYIGPQGDQVVLMTKQGLKTFGWWDQRYSTNGHHELDYISRALHKSKIKGIGKASLCDLHPHWNLDGNGRRTLSYNPVGLETSWSRMSHGAAPQVSSHQVIYDRLGWQKEKWAGASFPWIDGYQTSYKGITQGSDKPEIDWYPWLDLENL